MKNYDLITPEGTKDLLFGECIVRRNIEKTLSRIFRSRGYSEMITPGLEFFDVFNLNSWDVIAQAELENGISGYLHSSVPGKVISTEPCFSPNGRQEYAVKIHFGGALSYLGKIHEEKKPENFSQNEIAKVLIKSISHNKKAAYAALFFERGKRHGQSTRKSNGDRLWHKAYRHCRF